MKGVKASYPFFQEDDNKYLKGAREATTAEWKLLARYEKTHKLMDAARIDDGFQDRPGYRAGGGAASGADAYADNVDHSAFKNPRLEEERVRITNKYASSEKTGKSTITQRVFDAEQKY